MRMLKIYTVVFAAGAVGYSFIEILWRGYTHISMTVAGGVCLVGLFTLDRMLGKRSFFKKCMVGALLITAFEFVIGCILNLALDLGVWDYSDRFLNILGQVCPIFSLLWFVISIPAFGISMAMNSLLVKEEADEKNQQNSP